MKRFMIAAAIILALGLGLTVGLLRLFDQTARVYADTGVRYVALDGADANDCSSVAMRCQTIQRAVDVAVEGDVIKAAAGTYSGVQERPSPSGYNGSEFVTQTVYISTAVTIRGGYTTSNDFADPPASVSIISPQGQGRGIFIAPGVTVTLQGLQLTDGNAAGFGGGGAPTYQDAGGALYADHAATTIDDCLFANNVGEQAGGLYINSGAFNLQNSVITANVATASNAGGLLIYSPLTGTISHNRVLSNSAVSNGGGLYLAYGPPDVLFTDNDFVGNAAGGDGGGIFWAGDALFSHNRVMSNSAGFNGGGMSVNGRSSLFLSNLFMGNETDYYGGGVYFTIDTSAFRDNTVIANASGRDGGGLLLFRSEGVFENNIVAQNQVASGESGSGVYIWGGTPQLAHTTIAQNSGGDGSGVYVRSYSVGDPEPGHVVLTNTILVSQTIGFYIEISNTAVLDGVLWYGNGTDIDGDGVITISHEYTGFPAFIDPVGGDFHIGAASAARDKGVNSSVTDDIDGEPRLGIPDIGADEYTRPVYLPVILR